MKGMSGDILLRLEQKEDQSLADNPLSTENRKPTFLCYEPFVSVCISMSRFPNNESSFFARKLEQPSKFFTLATTVTVRHR